MAEKCSFFIFIGFFLQFDLRHHVISAKK